MHRSDRAALRRLQAVLMDPRRPDGDVRRLAALQVSLILARVEGRRLLTLLQAAHEGDPRR
jgi:hypothetical protein